MIATPDLDVSALLGQTVRYGHMVGCFTDLAHVAKPWTGLDPGLFGSFCEQPSAVCRGCGCIAVHVPYGDTIDFEGEPR